jgi:hypothetical protein
VDGGLYAGGPDLFRLVPNDAKDGHVADLMADSGRLWVLFSRPAAWLVRHWDGQHWHDQSPVMTGFKARFLCRWKETVWAGTERGLWPLAGKETKPMLIQGVCTAAWSDRQGRLWVGTEGKGVLVLDSGGVRHLTRETGLADDHVQAVFGDDEGLVWICTGRGLSKVVSLAYRGHLSDLPVMAMVEHEGDRWFATDEAGIWRMDGKGVVTNTAGAASGLPSDQVRALAVFRGRLYVGTKAGLRRWTGARFQPADITGLEDEYILNLQVIRDRLWISTLRRGVTVWDGQAGRAYDTRDGLPSTTVWSVAALAESLWIGTEGGLCRLGSDGSLTRIGERDGLGCDQIRALWADEATQTLWAATGNGLYRLQGARWLSFSRAEGLLSPHVSSLLPVGSDLWLGTEQGIFILSDGRLRRGPTGQTGLLGGEECSGVSGLVRSGSGTIWYLSSTGATEIDPAEIEHPAWPVPLRIDGLKSGKTEWPLPLSAPLPRNMKELTFSYRALALTDERSVRYRTRLDGLDEAWSAETTSGTVRYTNLGGGRYTLRVSSRCTEDGPWSAEAGLSFDIEPAFYERGWVIVMGLMLFAGGSYYLGLGVKRALGALTFFRRVRYIGHFRILDTLGSGGMGMVYKAVDLQNSGRIVALKVLKDEGFASDSGKRRFQLEGSIIDQFDHPGIVRNLERGEIDGSLYIAMEYIDGRPLSHILRDEGALPLDRAVGIMVQLLDVLDRLHQKGVLHRDLKPENLMVCRGDPPRIKLLDFGLALRESQTRLTQTGMVMGTLHFLPPERILSGVSTPPGDVYGAGVLFYEMLSDRRPFEGDGLLEIMKSIIDSVPPPLHALRPDLPRELGDLVMAMLARDPGLRPTAKEALLMLRQVEVRGERSALGLD